MDIKKRHDGHKIKVNLSDRYGAGVLKRKEEGERAGERKTVQVRS